MNEQTPATIRGLRLLPKELLITTGPVDHADWNYGGLLGAIQRERFRLIKRLLGQSHFGDLLELGYGSGVFAPELAMRCVRYHGVDVHSKPDAVTAALSRIGIGADLRQASASALPFDDGSFDCIVGVSVLEFVQDLDAACAEIRRVLKPGGILAVVTPGHSMLLDFGLKVMTGASARRDFGNRRQLVVPSVRSHLSVVRQIDYPLPFLGDLYLYKALMLRKES